MIAIKSTNISYQSFALHTPPSVHTLSARSSSSGTHVVPSPVVVGIALALEPHGLPAFHTEAPIAVLRERWQDEGAPGGEHEFGVAVD